MEDLEDPGGFPFLGLRHPRIWGGPISICEVIRLMLAKIVHQELMCRDEVSSEKITVAKDPTG